MFSGEMPYTLKNKAALSFLTQALNSRYLVSIREEKGGTYGVQVSGSTEYIPSETYNMTISFDTNEEMADELREIVMKEIEEIAANGPKSEDIEKPQQQIRLRARLPGRLRRGAQDADRRRRTGHGQEGAFRR